MDNKNKGIYGQNKNRVAIKKNTDLFQIWHLIVTEKHVKKKINFLRATFKFESNKMKKSRLSGSATYDLYLH